MVQIEFLKQLWKNCLRQSRLEDVLHTASGENQIITIAALTDGLSSQPLRRPTTPKIPKKISGKLSRVKQVKQHVANNPKSCKT